MNGLLPSLRGRRKCSGARERWAQSLIEAGAWEKVSDVWFGGNGAVFVCLC